MKNNRLLHKKMKNKNLLQNDKFNQKRKVFFVKIKNANKISFS